MTELHSALPSTVPETAVEPRFYVVSKRKFTILFLVTLGLYQVYWFYKNWDRFQDQTPYAPEARDTIWPVMRGIFAVVFVHALFRKIKEYGSDKLQIRAWSNAGHATQLVVLLIVSGALDRLSRREIGSPYTDVLSLLILAPMLLVYRPAQDIINVACDDPQGAGNDKLTPANYFWIVLGTIAWFLILLGFVLPAPE